MASRQTQKLVYASDIFAKNYTRRVDDHLATQSVLGWTAPIGGEEPLNHSIRPRHAVGKDATGASHSVVVAQTTADLWTRTATTWQILGDDGALVTVDLTGLVGEAVTL